MPIEIRPFVAFGFKTTHEALAAERVLTDAGLDVVPIPSPASFGALCGIAMRVPPVQEASALEALAHADIRPERTASIEDRTHSR